MYQQRYGLTFTEEQIKAYTTVGGTPHLDGEYTVFGEVVDGLDVIDKIAKVKTGYMDVPVEAVTMTIEILK
jgi:peptidyl-prolyl cis-trans isomerase B (cyclophilin B)